MKKTAAISLCLLFIIFNQSYAQIAAGPYGYMGSEGGILYGGLGVSVIDDQTYFAVNFRPELAFGKLGVGLDVNFRLNTETGELRNEDWDESYDYFRLLRYVRWGHKWDPVYARIGTLDAARLGHGFIVNFYTNEASYDNRKIGLAFDLDFGMFGFETITSNLARAELLAGRAYYRPLYGMKLPVLRNLAVGASYATDLDPDAWDASDDGVSVLGLDVELPIIKTDFFRTMLYADWAQISGYSALEDESRTFGDGQAVGVSATLGNLAGAIDLSAKLERRWLGKEFMASYFDPFYELQRYQEEAGVAIRKSDMLLGLTEETKGYFGELYGNVMNNSVLLLGMFSRLDDQKHSGILHLSADAPNAVPAIAAHATYDKMGIETVDDVFTLDWRSIARVGLGYKIKPYLILYVDYIWTFVETEPGSKVYKPQERIEPKLVFSYRF